VTWNNIFNVEKEKQGNQGLIKKKVIAKICVFILLMSFVGKSKKINDISSSLFLYNNKKQTLK